MNSFFTLCCIVGILVFLIYVIKIIYISITNSNIKYVKPTDNFDSYTIGNITNIKYNYTRRNDKIVEIRYSLNGKTFTTTLNHDTIPTGTQFINELLGSREATFFMSSHKEELARKPIYIYFNNEDPSKCFVSAKLVSELDSIFRN